MRQKMMLKLDYKRMAIADALVTLQDAQERGFTHAQISVSEWRDVPPKERKLEQGHTGKIRLDGRDGTVRSL